MVQIRQYIAFLLLLAFLFTLKFLSTPTSKLPPVTAPLPTPVPTMLPTPTPTPRPLTLKEMNALYGPCTTTPTLMYHHIQPLDLANAAGHAYLTVSPEVFNSQMQYLNSRGYTPITMSSLISFFDQGSPLPSKPILLTFDDGYADFYTYAYPILKSFNFPSTVFLPTGLMNNPDYLTWSQIGEMASLVNFANHTWSHRNTNGSQAELQKEITTADTQLTQNGLNSSKTFASPYGSSTTKVASILTSLNYRLAFLTTPGRILCNKQRFTLPRLRIGNSSLSSYGL